jgi:heme-based aerotactic transducer
VKGSRGPCRVSEAHSKKVKDHLREGEEDGMLSRREQPNLEHDVLLELSGELASQAKVTGLTERDLAVARGIRRHVERHITEIVGRFYDAIALDAGLMQIIDAHSTLDRLRRTLQAHVLEMLEGRINENYIARRQQVARTHLRIRLAAKWYIGSFTELERAIVDVCERYIRPQEMTAVRDAVRRLLSIEKQIVLEAFEEASDAVKQQMADMKRKVSERVNESAVELAAVTEESSASVAELATQSQEIVRFARSVAEITERVERAARDGMTRLDAHLDRLQTIQSGVKDIGVRIGQLRDGADRIRAIADMVRKIAVSTNILALNATIQAAHAGDMGKGFAVVAGEIKQLAHQVKGMADEAADMIRSIMDGIQSVTDALPGIADGVDAASAGMEASSRFFGNLVADMGDISTKTGGIEQELAGSASALEEVSRAIARVAESAEALRDLTGQL